MQVSNRNSIFLIIFSLFLCSFTQVSAQELANPNKEVKRGFDPKKIFYGGNFGLSFGTFTSINLAPIVGYQFNEVFASGVGLNYNYIKVKSGYFYANSSYEASAYGFKVFARETFGGSYFLYQELENMHYPLYDVVENRQVPYSQNYVWVGGGLLQRFGNGNSGASVMILYNLNSKQGYDIYPNPMIRIGFTFGN